MIVDSPLVPFIVLSLERAVIPVTRKKTQREGTDRSIDRFSLLLAHVFIHFLLVTG